MDEVGIPIVVRACVEFLRTTSLDLEGLFRVSGNMLDCKKVANLFRMGDVTPKDFMDIDPHAVAGVLKKFLRELPEPLLSYDLFDSLIEASKIDDTESYINHTKALINTLPEERKATLEYLFHFIAEVSEHSEVNKMAPSNLAIVFGPTLMRSRAEVDGTFDPLSFNPAAVNTVIERMIHHHDKLFCVQPIPPPLGRPVPPHPLQRPQSFSSLPNKGDRSPRSRSKPHPKGIRPTSYAVSNSQSSFASVLDRTLSASQVRRRARPRIKRPSFQPPSLPQGEEASDEKPFGKPAAKPKGAAKARAKAFAKGGPKGAAVMKVAGGAKPKATVSCPHINRANIAVERERAIARAHFEGDASIGQLSFQEHDILFIDEKDSSGWWIATHSETMQQGIVPSTYLSVNES